MLILQQMLIFFSMILLGYYTGKKGMITSSNRAQISRLIISISGPAMVLSGAINATEKIPIDEFITSGGYILAFVAAMVVVAEILSRLLKFPKHEIGAVNLMFITSNLMFIGLPLIKNVYGDDATIYMVLFMIPINILFYSYGIISVSRGADEAGKMDLKKVLNPGVIASLITIVLYFVDIPIHYVISSTVNMVGNLTAPLGMMLLGASFLEIDIKSLFKDWRLLVFSITKMVVFPIIVLMIFKQFVDNEALLGTFYVAIATPVGSLVSVLATTYNMKAYEVTNKGVALTTIVAIVTMPLVSMITGIC